MTQRGLFGRLRRWLRARPRRRIVLIAGLLLAAGLVAALIAGIRLLLVITRWSDPRSQAFIRWGTGDSQAREALISAQPNGCPDVPFILPTYGYIGLLYGDPRAPYSAGRPHQGIDIFSPGAPGESPVYAAADGYVYREPDWKSSLIIRVPDDPLNPGRQIWLYYTHMANQSGTVDYIDPAFPPGTREKFVQQGTLLGYTGNYNGGSPRSVWVHLHFSIVLDDGTGSFTNELDFNNTVDPSRYLGMAVNYGCADVVPACTPDPLCPAAVLGAGGG